MPKGIVSALALAALAVGVIVAFQLGGSDAPRTPGKVVDAAPVEPRSPAASAASPSVATPAGQPSATRPDATPDGELPASDHPAVRRQRAHRELEGRLRTFFAGADRLPVQARRAEADALLAAVLEGERTGALLPPEAVALRIALMRARAGDSEEWRAEADALTERYRSESEARERAARSARETDPRFVDYKRRELEIVREVMALPENVGGRPRDAILRERLDEARRAAWGNATGAPGR